MLVPEFAFEVEHTTDVTKGLGRLRDQHKSGQRTRLFIILPVDKMGKFDKEIERSLFRDIKGICRARSYLKPSILMVLTLSLFTTTKFPSNERFACDKSHFKSCNIYAGDFGVTRKRIIPAGILDFSL